MFRAAVPLRLGGAVMLGTLAALYAAYDPVPWKVALPATTALVMAILVPVEHRLLPPVLSAGQVAWFLFPVQVGISVLATLTGGIESPFLLMMPMVSLGTVIGTGQPRLFGPGLALMGAVGWFLALGDLAGPLVTLRPGLFRHGPLGPLPAGQSLSIASFLTGALVLPAVIGVHLRRALDRAVSDAIAARAENVATLEETNAELMALSRTVAHELKNPLAAIQGLASVVARKQPPGSQEAERMDVLLGEAKRLGGLLDEFLDFGRPARGLAVRPVQPDVFLREVVLLHEPRARELRIHLEYAVNTVRPLRCDPRKVRQVIANLVGNALDATPAGGWVRLEVSDAPEGGHDFRVLDDGPGLSPEVADRLFHVGATTKPGGSGLGLTIARMIAQQHGGTLTLDARPGGGCRAWLHLPREAVTTDREAS